MSKRIAVDSVSTLKRQGVNKQLGQTVKTEGLPPGTSDFLQRQAITLQRESAGERGFKHMSVLETFYIQTITVISMLSELIFILYFCRYFL